MENKILKTAENLRANNMEPFILESRDEVLPLLKSLIAKGATVGVGGSVTLDEIGVIPFLREGDYSFFDRYAQGLSREQAEEIMGRALTADTFITSSNALTEGGALYNVDGNGNRVAALCFGPKNVIVIVGVNKIVKDIAEAEERVKSLAAPKNCRRLGIESPCFKSGQCVSLSFKDRELTDGCTGQGRICCSYLVTGYQRSKGRIKVIIVKDNLGY